MLVCFFFEKHKTFRRNPCVLLQNCQIQVQVVFNLVVKFAIGRHLYSVLVSHVLWDKDGIYSAVLIWATASLSDDDRTEDVHSPLPHSSDALGRQQQQHLSERRCFSQSNSLRLIFLWGSESDAPFYHLSVKDQLYTVWWCILTTALPKQSCF